MRQNAQLSWLSVICGNFSQRPRRFVQVYHEAAVAEYARGNFSHSAAMFEFAYSLVASQPIVVRRRWAATALNAGHASRKIG
jgi:hypothetical protein